MTDRLLAAEVRAEIQTKGRDERTKQDAIAELCKAKGVTLTQALLMLGDRGVATRLMRALTGMRLDEASGNEQPSARPVLPFVQLRSLLKKCADCQKNTCGRRGQFHPITY